MKKIDAHSHIEFGGWAKVAIDIDKLIKQMDEYEIERWFYVGRGAMIMKMLLMYKNTKIEYFIVYTNPCEGKVAIEKFITM